jgi:metallophosphoesterase (TIGR00282 family)
MKILYIAEIVGKAGVYAYKKGLPELKTRFGPDFIIACADGATGGSGLGRNHAAYLHKLGANVLTTGECCFFKKDLTENLAKIPYVLRPDNLNPEAPGIGSRVFKAGNIKVAVAVLLGQSSFGRIHGNSPFSGLPALLERLRLETPFTFIDFHAQATAEKQTFFAMADGHCSAVVGSHCRVQTADEKVLPRGTAVITDAGRSGSQNSVGGNDPDSRIQEYLTGIPNWTKEAWAKPELQGLLIDIGDDGKARSIERIRHAVPDAPNSAQDSGESNEADIQEEGDD